MEIYQRQEMKEWIQELISATNVSLQVKGSEPVFAYLLGNFGSSQLNARRWLVVESPPAHEERLARGKGLGGMGCPGGPVVTPRSETTPLSTSYTHPWT